jgi:hypothetical protein
MNKPRLVAPDAAPIVVGVVYRGDQSKTPLLGSVSPFSLKTLVKKLQTF